LSELRIKTAEVFEPLLAPARYKGARGGRGSGKSHFFAELWLEENIAEKKDFVCIREVQKDLQHSVKRLLELKIINLQRRGVLRCSGQENPGNDWRTNHLPGDAGSHG
jgi:phage terminase large subunit